MAFHPTFLAAWRLEAGYTSQASLAASAHVALRTINELERNPQAPASDLTLRNMADAISNGLQHEARRRNQPLLPFGPYDLIACSPSERRNAVARGEKVRASSASHTSAPA